MNGSVADPQPTPTRGRAGEDRTWWGRAVELIPEIALVLVSTTAGVWAGGRWVEPLGDAGRWWSIVYRLDQGERLYADIHFQFGPLSPYLLAGLGRLFGLSPLFFLLLQWIPAVVAGLLLLRLARPLLPFWGRIAVAGLLLGFSLFVPGRGRLVYPYAPASVHALLLGCIALLLVHPWARRPRPALAGLLAGLAVCAKQEIGLAVMAALSAAWMLGACAWQQIRAGAAAFLAVVALGAGFVLWAAPLASIQRESHVWPFAWSPPAEWQALYAYVAGIAVPGLGAFLLESAALLAGLLSAAALVGLVSARERRRLPWATCILGVTAGAAVLCFRSAPIPSRMACLSMTVSFVVVLLGLRERDASQRAAIVALGTFAGLIGLRTAFSRGVGGEYMGIANFVPCLTWVLFVGRLAPARFPGGVAGQTAARVALLGAALASWTLAVGGMRALAAPRHAAVDTPLGRVFMEREEAVFFRVLNRHLRRGEAILVLPEINGVDAVFGLRSVSPDPLHLPGWVEDAEEEALVERLAAAPPEHVVLFDRPAEEYGVRPFGEGYARKLAGWLARNYAPLVKRGSGTLYRRAEKRAAAR